MNRVEPDRVADFPIEPLNAGSDSTTGFGHLAFVLVVAFVVAGRLIEDIYTVPVGLSLHPTDVILGILFVVWLLWMFTAPQNFPIGIASVLGVAVSASVLVAPFLNALGMSEFEVNGSDTGLVRATLYAVLFIASYQLAASRRRARQLLTVTVAVTIFQAVLAVYEQLVGEPLKLLGTIWQSVGLVVDPKATRDAVAALQQRLTGELRASATAPHPLVLAGLLAVGIGICIALYLHGNNRRTRRWLLVALALQFLAIGATNQRTAFVAVAVIVVVLGFTQINRLPSMLPLMATAVAGAIAVAVVSPSTPRLILNFVTGQHTDHNIAVRASKYEIFPQLLERRPFFGAGYATSDPELVTFDNGYLTGFVELGIVGFGLLLAFLLVVTGRTFGSLHKAPNPDQPILLAGTLAAVTFFTTMATFDVMSFAQLFPTVLMVMAIGLARAEALRRKAAVGRSRIQPLRSPG